MYSMRKCFSHVFNTNNNTVLGQQDTHAPVSSAQAGLSWNDTTAPLGWKCYSAGGLGAAGRVTSDCGEACLGAAGRGAAGRGAACRGADCLGDAGRVGAGLGAAGRVGAGLGAAGRVTFDRGAAMSSNCWS